MCIYRRKLRRILRKRAARSCCSRPPRRFIRSTTRTRRRSAFFTLPAESGRPHRAADEQKPESALRTSIGRTLMRVDRRRKPPSSRSARGPDRAEPNVRTDVSRADLPRVAFESICDQAACPRLVRLPINSEHYTRLSRLWRRDLFLLLGRRACRRDHGNVKKRCNSNAERNHDRSSPLARQPCEHRIVRLRIFDGHCDFAMRCDGCHQSLRLSGFSISLLRPSVVSSASAALD